MNLSRKITINELCDLISRCKGSSAEYHLVVDMKGEVIILDSQDISRSARNGYKFYFFDFLKGLDGKEAIKNQKFINQLFKNLMYCHEYHLEGRVDQPVINRVQNLSYWLRNNALPGNVAASVSV